MRKYIYIYCCILVLLASCEKRSCDELRGQPIYLSVSLPDDPLTKTPFEGSAPTTTNPLNVSVWASTTSSIYENKGWDGSAANSHKVAIHTYGHFQSGAPQLLSQAIYPPPRVGESGTYTADPVYFVAMYPQSSSQKLWTTTDGKLASYTFTGCEDLMFAPQVWGAYDTQVQDQVVNVSPLLVFEHLLTRISVKMGIVLEEGENRLDVQNAWGKVTDIKIQSYDSRGGGILEGLNSVTVDLSQGESFDYDTDLIYEYAGAGSSIGTSLNFFCMGSDIQFPGSADLLLTEQMEEVAYVMCAPVVATTESHEYLITVTTEHRGDQQIVLDLMENASGDQFEGSTRGKHFGVTLKFKKGSAIATTAVVNEWKNGGYGAGEIED